MPDPPAPEADRVYALAQVADLFGPELVAQQVAAIDVARSRGATWEQIGEAMGVSGRAPAFGWYKRNRTAS